MSSLLVLMMHDNSKSTGNHPLIQTLSIPPRFEKTYVKSSQIKKESLGIPFHSLPESSSSIKWVLKSDTYLAHLRIKRIASIETSGKSGLQANSDRHLTQS